MGSSVENRGGTCPAMVIDNHEHLQSYVAKKQVSFDVKAAAQQRVGNALLQPDCQPSSSKNPIPIGEVCQIFWHHPLNLICSSFGVALFNNPPAIILYSPICTWLGCHYVWLLFNMISLAQDSVRGMQQMERMHDSVLDAIHAALSKESLIKKLVLPFNETIDSATKVNIQTKS